jgi:hypothetical protein
MSLLQNRKNNHSSGVSSHQIVTTNIKIVHESTKYLLAPPASGETMTASLHSEMFSLIHLRTAGSAYKLSTRRDLMLITVRIQISDSFEI